MSGLDLLREVRRDDRTKALPFVLVTAEANSLHVEEARRAGANNYLVKPFTLPTLKLVLSSILGDL
jgi:two-component system chemotaxis response regulator CheY